MITQPGLYTMQNQMKSISGIADRRIELKSKQNTISRRPHDDHSCVVPIPSDYTA